MCGRWSKGDDSASSKSDSKPVLIIKLVYFSYVLKVVIGTNDKKACLS